MRISNSTVVAVFLIILAFQILNIRFIIYTIPILALLKMWLVNKYEKNSLTTAAFILLIITIFTGLLSFIVTDEAIHSESLKQLFFLVAGLFSALIISNGVKVEFLIGFLKYFTILFLANEFVREPFYIFSLILNPLRFFIDSESDTETIFAFVYGLLTLLFLKKKDYKYAGMSLLLVSYGGKRIVFLAIALSLIIQKLYLLFPRIRRLIGWGFAGISLFYISLVRLIIDGSLDSFFTSVFGATANYILKGRVYLFSSILNHFENFSYFGYGVGSTSDYLINGFLNTTLTLLHSEILRLYIEIGLVSSVIWFYTLGKIASFTKESMLFTSYLFILMFSDNVLIYMETVFMVFFFIIVFGSSDLMRGNKNEK